MNYYQEGNLFIRSMKESDGVDFVKAFEAQGWQKPLDLFQAYFMQQSNRKRKVIVAETNKKLAGYVTLVSNSNVGPFASINIPEIVDLNVLIRFQNRGIGNKMMDVAERLASETCDFVSLAVGLHYGYGAAQRMYSKRGYIPDGTGVWYQGKQLEQYAPCVNDDDLTVYLLKELAMAD
ncbi:GNAT family N-acetyltransferase [Rossellomorea aquimaris]|uniref:GNAT family N-acetyltransferase n=1 Tax=Rossellomorea aquimaris TaxID=189382 RepID=UPI001CD52FB2|nr:GNAT family N-acetyltransferase [Rossellomorea aquimaris]MCA1054102.1 GNAT family N-acetyltransferase [Rossellomorea aquimaris]